MRAPHDSFRIYIAGPMTGIDKYNFPAFDAAAQDLRDMGFHPVSPADIDRAHGFDPTDPREQAEMHTNLRDPISLSSPEQRSITIRRDGCFCT